MKLFQKNLERFASVENAGSDRAKEIASADHAPGQVSSFDRIIKELEQENLLSSEVTRVKTKVEALCPFDRFLQGLSEEEWRWLAVIELHDEATFEHSLGTYLTAKEKIEHELKPELGEPIRLELGDHDVFYRACLFHDIGKVEIPSEILNHPLDESGWDEKLADCCADAECRAGILDNLAPADRLAIAEAGTAPDALLDYLRSAKVPTKQIIPLKNLLEPAAAAKLSAYALGRSLGRVMMDHEQASRAILEASGRSVEARLVGSHHGYGDNSRKTLDDYPASLSTLRMGNTLIQLSDIQSAFNEYTHPRNYLRGYNADEARCLALGEIIDKTAEGKIIEKYARLWLEVEYGKISHENIEKSQARDALDKVDAFRKAKKD